MLDLDAIHDLASNPEYLTVEDFVMFCLEDERATFSHTELRALALNTKTSGNKVREELESYGLTLLERPAVKHIRGFTANPHDRWIASGNCGGSGGDQILGFAGRRG
jgi:hypothetical protein